MAGVQDGGTGNVLSSRMTKKLFDEVSEDIFREFRKLPADEGWELLMQVRNTLEQEITTEQRFQSEFKALQEDLLRSATPVELAQLHKRLVGVVTAFFSRRESVSALHALCTTVLDMTVGQALRIAEDELKAEGLEASYAYAWLVLGATGRREATFSMQLESLLVHEPGEDAAAYCARVATRGTAILAQCGIEGSERGIMPDLPAWCASLEEWEVRLEELCRRSGRRVGVSARSGLRLGDFFSRKANLSTPLFELADLRVAAGNHELGGELLHLVRVVAQRHPACIMEAAQTVSSLPAPFNFFGKYRVERSGPHRGRVDLNRWACFPLIAMVRLQAVTGGVVQTGTLERIKLLLRQGALDVALGQRLLMAGGLIFRLKTQLEAREQAGVGDGVWLSPESLTPQEDRALREALESVSTLQKVIHSSLAQQV